MTDYTFPEAVNYFGKKPMKLSKEVEEDPDADKDEKCYISITPQVGKLEMSFMIRAKLQHTADPGATKAQGYVGRGTCTAKKSGN